jgi:hypothetical protein
MPYTFGNRRSAWRSLSTPFCMHTIGWSVTPAARRSFSTPAVSWLLTPSMNTSSSATSISEIDVATGSSTVRVPEGDS